MATALLSDGGLQMTMPYLKKLCREMDLYSTPSLNDKLYLHYKGFKKIEALDEYTGLKVLYLEGNGFDAIEGLTMCTELKCLYLQENLIEEITGLETLTSLDSLNLNNNRLRGLPDAPLAPADGASELASPLPLSLSSLTLQHNRIASVASLAILSTLPKLSVLDLSNNAIADGPDALFAFLASLPALRVLYLRGNPCVEQVESYRKSLVARLPHLSFLDDRPVFPAERRAAEAWLAGGAAGEQAARAEMRAEEQAAALRQHEGFEALIREARREAGLPEEEDELLQRLRKEGTEEERRYDEEHKAQHEDKDGNSNDDADEASAGTTAAAAAAAVPAVKSAKAAIAPVRSTGGQRVLIEEVDDDEEADAAAGAAAPNDDDLIPAHAESGLPELEPASPEEVVAASAAFIAAKPARAHGGLLDFGTSAAAPAAAVASKPAGGKKMIEIVDDSDNEQLD